MTRRRFLEGAPVRLRLGPPRSEPWSSASRSGRSAIRANSLRDPRSVRPTAAVRCAKVRSASRPAGHSESGWSDKVSADVERTTDSTSSSENLSQRPISRAPRRSRDRWFLSPHCASIMFPAGATASCVSHGPGGRPRWPAGWAAAAQSCCGRRCHPTGSQPLGHSTGRVHRASRGDRGCDRGAPPESWDN